MELIVAAEAEAEAEKTRQGEDGPTDARKVEVPFQLESRDRNFVVQFALAAMFDTFEAYDVFVVSHRAPLAFNLLRQFLQSVQ